MVCETAGGPDKHEERYNAETENVRTAYVCQYVYACAHARVVKHARVGGDNHLRTRARIMCHMQYHTIPYKRRCMHVQSCVRACVPYLGPGLAISATIARSARLYF